MIVTFIGHAKMHISKELIKQLTIEIENCIRNGADTFYCGHYGAFDIACANVLKKLKSKFVTVKSVFVTPYINESYQNNLKMIKEMDIYDEIQYPGIESAPYRFAIIKRNKYMIDAANMIIAFVARNYGGAFTTYKYALSKGKAIINLAEKFEK